jgi:hypothetical protein
VPGRGIVDGCNSLDNAFSDGLFVVHGKLGYDVRILAFLGNVVEVDHCFALKAEFGSSLFKVKICQDVALGSVS